MATKKKFGGESWIAEVDAELNALANDFSVYQNVKFSNFLKVYHLVVLQRKWRLCEVDRSGEQHPADQIIRLIGETRKSFQSALDVIYISTSNYFGGSTSGELNFNKIKIKSKSVTSNIEDGHQVLFNTAFPATNDRESRRNRVSIIKKLISDSEMELSVDKAEVLDIGCGSCEWARAYLEFGASHVTGIDYGNDTLELASSNLNSEGWGGRFKLIHNSLYDLSKFKKKFDLVSQIGVFHHLDDQEAALNESLRVLKSGGTLVYAAAGKGGIRYALQDKIRVIMDSISINELLDILQVMGVSPEQKFHLCDMFKAYYHRESWDELSARLSSSGLTDFVRMPNELDEPDVFSKEKYGDGFMKFYCRYTG